MKPLTKSTTSCRKNSERWVFSVDVQKKVNTILKFSSVCSECYILTTFICYLLVFGFQWNRWQSLRTTLCMSKKFRTLSFYNVFVQIKVYIQFQRFRICSEHLLLNCSAVIKWKCYGKCPIQFIWLQFCCSLQLRKEWSFPQCSFIIFAPCMYILIFAIEIKCKLQLKR